MKSNLIIRSIFSFLLSTILIGTCFAQEADVFFPGEDLRFSPKKGLPYLKTLNQTAQSMSHMSRILENGRVVFLFSDIRHGEVKVTVYDHSALRVQWHWTHPYPKDEVALEYSDLARIKEISGITSGEELGYFWIRTTLMEARISKIGDFAVDFHCPKTGKIICKDESVEFNPSYEPREDDTYLGLQGNPRPPLAFKIKNSKQMEAKTAFIGLGDWAGPINRRGHRIQFWNEDAYGWSEYQSPKYTSFPIFYGITPSESDGASLYGIFFNNPSRTVFNLGTERDDVYSFEAADGQIDYFFFYDGGADLGGLIDSLTKITGRSAMLPKWGYGYHMSRFSYNQQELDELLNNFIFINMPLSCIFIDLDYMDQTDIPRDRDWSLHQFKWNKTEFPDPNRIIDRLERRGVMSTIIVEPFLDSDDPKFEIAKQAGFLVETVSGETVEQSIWCAEKIGWIDFTNPEARDWWRTELSDFLKKYGIKGVWNDLNETADVGGIPLDGNYNMGGRFSDRTDSRRWHLNVKNTHSLYGTRVSYEALLQAWPGTRPFVLSRGGFPGVQRWAAGWSGDNVASESHLRHNIRAGVSISICGFSNYGHDVGGFTGHPNFRVFQRWHEWSAFTPLMRNHSGSNNPRRDPFFYSEGERELLKKTTRWRYYFLPHLYSLAHQCTVDGWPMNAPVAAVFPNEEESYYLNEYDFMVGKDVLLAPVVFEQDNERAVRLPRGGAEGQEDMWHSFWTDESYRGGESVKVQAGLGFIPLFVREGGMVAVNPQAWSMTSPEKDNARFSNTEFHFWGGEGEYHFYDDDGVTLLENPDEERLQLVFKTQSYGDNLVIQVLKSGDVQGREYRLVVRGQRFSSGDFFVNGELVRAEKVEGAKVRGENWEGRSVKLDFSSQNGCVVLLQSP